MREKRVHKVGSNPIPISEISIGDLIDLVEKPDLSWLVMVNQIIPSCASGEGRIKITWIDNPRSKSRDLAIYYFKNKIEMGSYLEFRR